MTDHGNLLAKGQQMLQEVALRYASQHGLRPDSIEWEDQGDQFLLKVNDADHSVKVPFSKDEIEDFAEEGEGGKHSKGKIRNAFASLAM